MFARSSNVVVHFLSCCECDAQSIPGVHGHVREFQLRISQRQLGLCLHPHRPNIRVQHCEDGDRECACPGAANQKEDGHPGQQVC